MEGEAVKVVKKRARVDASMEEYHEITWTRLLDQSIVSTSPPKQNFDKQCRLWTGSVDCDGYGKSSYRKKPSTVHRISLMIKEKVDFLPRVNEEGELMHARHLCDVRNCFEPSHLMFGTIMENGEDKAKSGTLKGDNNVSSKITEDLARQIKLSKLPEADTNYLTRRQRALKFGVSSKTVQSIDLGNSWAWLPFIDGTISTARIDYLKKENKKRRKLSKATPWTKEQWKNVEEKLTNVNYVQESKTRMFNNVYCKEWLKRKHNGYGIMSIHGNSERAHIIACTIANNYVRPDKLLALHKCGNASCVEFTHLQFGTAEENMKDKRVHGTSKAKLSLEQEAEVRKLFAEGNVTKSALAKQFKVSNTTMRRIIWNK